MTLFAFSPAECLDLARWEGTPLFAYRRSCAGAAYARLRAALPDRVRVAYAVKANPHPALLQTFAALGASFDCASGGELDRVARLQMPPGRLFYAGPGKRQDELAQALAMGVRIQAEGWEDLARLEALATTPVAVNLRVHPSDGIEEERPILGGTGPSAFGVDEEDVPDLLDRARSLCRVRIEGIHVFAASNQRSAERLLGTHARVLALVQGLSERFGLDLAQVDLGGGLGVPYAPGQPELDVERLGRGLGDLLEAHAWFRGELVLEPGRFLAAGCGVYLARVLRVKESRGVRFVILEGGIHHLLRPLLTGEPFPVAAPGGSGPERPATLAGPLCTSLDRLGDVLLPEVAPGQLLAFGMTGAYGFTEAMAPFLSHPPAKECCVS
jgi:diaminopimelate decarboxylase